MTKQFILLISLMTLFIVHGRSQFAKGTNMGSLVYSSFGYCNVSDQKYELRLGHFFFKNISAGLFGSIESRPYLTTPIGNNIYGGYDSYSFGLYGQKYFHIYKSFYLFLSLDAVRVKSTPTSMQGSGHPVDYTLVNARLSLLFRPTNFLGIEISNGWTNYSYLYFPEDPFQKSYFKFNYSVDPGYYSRWFLGVSYYLARKNDK